MSIKMTYITILMQFMEEANLCIKYISYLNNISIQTFLLLMIFPIDLLNDDNKQLHLLNKHLAVITDDQRRM